MKLHLVIPAVAAILTAGIQPTLSVPVPLNIGTDQRLVLINIDGTISRSIGGVVSSQSFNSIGFTGRYEVIFNRDVTKCIYLGNVGTPGASGAGEGTVSFTSRALNPNGIFVERRDVAGKFVNGSFFVGVFCPRVTK
ncbi:MAG: hypothetical protein KME17_18215 [Cyanosarcina radialis HA8281-LM2]|nr:hypothetical protein [Cyanosarcina radialis HA8281-LM2]